MEIKLHISKELEIIVLLGMFTHQVQKNLRKVFDSPDSIGWKSV